MKECPRCQHIHFVKNGFVNAKQRYKCKSCHYQFTRKTPRGKPQTHKTLALLLYCHGISMNAISKLFDSHVLYPINGICSARSPCLALLTLSENFESS